MDLRKLKDKASEAFAKGKFAKAADLYAEYCKADARDLQARLRMGDAFAKSGQKGKAIEAYKFAAEGFARDGFLPRAIAASKLILEIDPSHQGVQQMLAELYAQKGVPDGRSSRPAPPARSALRDEPPAVISRRAPIDLPPDEPSTPSITPAPEPAIPAAPAASSRRAPIELPEEPSTEPMIEMAPAIELETGPAGGAEIEIAIGEPAAVDFSAELPPELQVHSPQPSAAAPPGLRRRSAEAAPPATAASPPPQPGAPPATAAMGAGRPPPAASAPAAAAPPSRIWLPGAADPASPAGAPVPLPASPRRDLDAGREAFSRFDTIEAEPATPPAGGSLSSFTELELEGDSLLHAVELAAKSGLAARGEGEAPDEVFDLPEEPSPGALPKIPLFSDLAQDAFIELFERCPLVRLNAGERVIQQGTTGSSFFVICAGSVRVVREEEGRQKELAVLQEGAFFGEMALLSEAPRTASVDSASDETQLLEISAPVLTDLSRRYPQVAQALKKFCRQRMLANVMASSPLFKPFGKSDRRSLVQRFRSREVAKGDPVIREGERSDGLYVILSGEVEVAKQGQRLAALREGDVFGEMSLLQKSPASATVSAARRTSLLRLPREDFDELILSHPQILVLVAELTDDRRRQTEAVLGGAAMAGEGGLLLV